MSVKGTLKSDQLVLVKLTYDRLEARIDVLAALTNSRSGETHGFVDGKGIQWSEDTLSALKALSTSMERDIARRHFQGEGEAGAFEPEKSGLNIPSGGLGEHLADGDAPSI